MNWENMHVSMQTQTNSEAAVHRLQNDCFTDFGKFPGKQPWWSPNLVRPHHGCFHEKFPKFLENIFFYVTP